ncbi:hypothetical protein L1987_15472 [Smallanthus sonchifolius]|uniref:Uncharacterized protein n=1 Tax=Smallanthus sonchifolius TaxID=185202 RepID=A0ACB9J663_9ASTR|nr:hypothetical protein L1987_15472 [Smallanthus sonchifolius]
MMNSIPHFDDVVDLDEDDEYELEITRSEAKSKGKRPISSTGSTTDAFNKKAKGTLYSVFKPSVVSGKKGGNLVGSKEYNDVQKKLRLDAVQKFSRWMGANSKTSSSSSRPRGLVDEPDYDFDVDAEENDVAAYKDFVPTSDPDDDDNDEPEYEDISD